MRIHTPTHQSILRQSLCLVPSTPICYGKMKCSQLACITVSAHLIVSQRKFDSISSTIRDVLHWLPIQQCIQYKLCTLVFTVCTLSHVCLSIMCQPVSENLSRRCLRSAARGDLAVPATRMVYYGHHGFAVVGPSTWSSLLTSLRNQSLTLTSFCRQLVAGATYFTAHLFVAN